MTRRAWLLGGTGSVGGHVTEMLAAAALEVTTVSRRSADPDSPYPHVSQDLAASDTALPVRAGDVVINLTEATTTERVLSILQEGAAFLETSATADYVLPTRDAVRAARPPGTLVDCVGVAPGLTNLLAHEMRRTHPGLRHVHIGGELGLGEHAGAAATRWFLDSLGATALAKIDGGWQELPTGSISRRFPFQDGHRARLALGFPFVEQALLAHEFEEDVNTVLTYLAFSPPWVTRLLWSGLRVGVGSMASRRAERLTRWMLRVPSLGEISTRIVVAAEDDAATCEWIRLETGDQSRASAAIVAATALAVDPMQPMTISTIADWISLDDAVTALTRIHAPTRLTRSSGTGGETQTARSGKKPMGATS